MLTLRAADAIREADVLRYDAACDRAILSMAGAGAEIGPYRDVSEIVALAGQQKRVAVLFRGDPYAFADGVEVARGLERAQVEFEVVPGMLMETAGPTLGGIPLTLEGRSASVAIGSPCHADTVVLRLPWGWWESGVRSLLRHGRTAKEPAALLTEAGSQSQHRLVAPLGDIVAAAEKAGLRGDAVIVVGPGVELADRLDTLSRRPLHGVRVLVTRARHQASAFARELIDLGAAVIEVPTIEIQALPNRDQAAAAIEHLGETRLVVFASANAVTIFFQLLLELGHDARHLYRSKIGAIGPETARMLEANGIKPDLVAGEYTAEGLAKALEGWDLKGWRVLIPRAQVARDALPQLLAQRGAQVEFLPVYRTVSPPSTADMLRRLLEGPWVDVVTFTSSSTVTNFVKALTDEQLALAQERCKIACIGPVTADTAHRLGLRVDIIARDYTTRGLALAIVESLSTSH
jgi:uroporphyrinogen III methyltransferase/synthase